MGIVLTIVGILFGGIGLYVLQTIFESRSEHKKELFNAIKEEYIKIYSSFIESDQASRRRDIQGKTEKEIVILATEELQMLGKRIEKGSRIIEHDYKMKHMKELSQRLKDYNKYRIYFFLG